MIRFEGFFVMALAFNVIVMFSICYKLWHATGGTNVLELAISDDVTKIFLAPGPASVITALCCKLCRFHAVNDMLLTVLCLHFLGVWIITF